MSRCPVVLFCVLTLLWSLCGCAAQARPELTLVEFMEGDPPPARLEGGSQLAPLAVDWAAVDGAASLGAPGAVDWTATSDEPAVLVLQTPAMPVRVIALDFAIVDSSGIPPSVGREQFCDVRHGQMWVAVTRCAFAQRGDQIVVRIYPSPAHRYVVIQAAWLANDMRQVSASWGFRFSS